MSLVLAANLIDRVYIAADTRLSVKKAGVYEVETDYQLKIEPISDHILIGCVGSGAMASYMTKRLKESVPHEIGIRDFRKILEKNMGEFTHDYLSSYQPETPEGKSIALIFAGSQPGQKKKVEVVRFSNLLKEFQDFGSKKLEERFKGKDPGTFTQEEANELYQIMMMYQKQMKPCFYHALRGGIEGGFMEIPVDDNDVFVLEIDANELKAEMAFKFFNTEWGDYVARGDGWREDRISRELMWALEFKKGNGDIRTDSLPFIREINQRYSTKVGGHVITYGVFDGKILFPTSTISIIDTKTGKENKIQQTDVVNDKLCAIREDDTAIPFRTLLEITSKGDFSL